MVDRFFHPKVINTGWHKNLRPSLRRARMLHAHHGNYLAAGKAMNALANVTRDKGAQRAARADAKYFFRQNEKQGRTMKFVD